MTKQTQSMMITEASEERCIIVNRPSFRNVLPKIGVGVGVDFLSKRRVRTPQIKHFVCDPVHVIQYMHVLNSQLYTTIYQIVN